MYRVERSPDEPMFRPETSRRLPSPGEAVVCAGDTIPEEVLLHLVPHRRVIIEPDPARAIALCLEGCPSRLLVDLAPLGPKALSVVAQLRLMRPDLSMVVLVGDEEPARLEGTVLEGTPMMRVPRVLLPSPEGGRAR